MAEELNNTLYNNIEDGALLAGSQLMPQYFTPLLQQKYPGMITTTGSGSRLGNFQMDKEIRMQQPGMFKAMELDQQNASRILSGIELTGKRMLGGEVSEADEAAARNRGEYAAQGLPAMFMMAQMMGLPPETITAMQQAMYGQKGSVAAMYQQGYGAFRPFMSAGQASEQMDRLITGQFGSEYDPQRMEGMSAQDMGSALRYLASSGGMNKGMFEKGSGLGLSRMGEETRKAVQRGESIDDIWDQQAVDMASTAYYEEAKADPSRNLAQELGDFLTDDQNKAFSAVEDIDAEIGNLETDTGYKVDIDTTIKDKDEALKKLNEQFDEKIKDAKEKKNDAAVKQLEETKKKLKGKLTDFYKESNEKDENGKRLTYQEINANREQILGEASDVAMNETVAAMQDEIADIENAKQEARNIEDPEERRAALDEIADWEDDLRMRQEEDPLMKQAGRVLDTTDAMDKAVAVGKMGQAVKDAFAANGQQVSVDEALEASKAITGDSLHGKDLDKIGKELAVTMQNAMEGGRSIQDLMASSASFNDIAKSLGIGNTNRAAMINMSGEQNYKSYIEQGMTPEEAAEQVKQDKIAMAKEGKTSNGKALQAMNGIVQGMSKEDYDKMIAHMDSDEDRELIAKIKNHEDLTQEEMRRVSKVSRKALKASGMSSKDASLALRNKDNLDRGADDYTTRQLEAKRNLKGQRKLTQGLKSYLGDAVTKKEDREIIGSALARNADKFKSAALKTGEDGTQARVDALNELADELDRSGESEAAEKVREAANSNDQAKINSMFNKLNDNMEKAGDRRVLAAKDSQMKNKRSDHDRAEANVELSEEIGRTGSTGMAGVLDAVKSGKSIKDIKDIYKAATGFDEIKEEDKNAIANAMVLNGHVQSGKFINASGDEDVLTKDEIDIAQQGASRMRQWEDMTEDEAENTGSGIKTRGGRELSVAEAREVTQKTFEAANAQLPGGADIRNRDEGFTKYRTKDEVAEEFDAINADMDQSSYNRAMKAADDLEKAGKKGDAEKIRKDAESGTANIDDVAKNAEDVSMGKSKGYSTPKTPTKKDDAIAYAEAAEKNIKETDKWAKRSVAFGAALEKDEEYQKDKKVYDRYKKGELTKEEFGAYVKSKEEGGLSSDESKKLDDKLRSDDKLTAKELKDIKKILEKLVS